MFKTRLPPPLTVRPFACCPWLLAFCLVISSAGVRAADWASFKSFYQGGWTVSWWSMGLGTVSGTASAVASSTSQSSAISALGTGIGTMFGLSGAAATRFGTALLGGGAAAGGGLALAGGASLLSAALSYSSDLVLDYSATRGVRPFQAQQFREASHGMMQLPFPVSDSGSPRMRETVRRLNSIDYKEHATPKSVMGTAEFRSALDLMRSEPEGKLSDEMRVRELALLALLELYAADYERAGAAVRDALGRVGTARHRVTVLHYVEAVAMLAAERPDHERSFAAFERAVLEEPDNPYATVMFAAYLDRLVTRMNDRSVPDGLLHEAHALAGSLKDERQQTVVRLGLLSRYLIRVKQEQQVVVSLRPAAGAVTADRSDPSLFDNAVSGYADLVAAAQDRMQDFKEAHCLRTFERERCQRFYELADALAAYSRELPGLAGMTEPRPAR
ncbi:MAG: hypothetical protein ACKODB_05910 [Betaproteobacteria bacterium]